MDPVRNDLGMPTPQHCASPPSDLLPPLLMPTGTLDGKVSRRAGVVSNKHNHYYKDVSQLDFIDVYRVLQLFNVADPCLQHAVKKLLVAGGRGAGKDISKDIQESIDSLQRWQEMRLEENDGSKFDGRPGGL